MSIFDDFFGFDKDFYNFSREVKDMAPYRIYRAKEENVILAPYMAYAKQYLNIHNTVFRVNLKINNGKLGPGHGSELKWPIFPLESGRQKTLLKVNGIKTILH